MFLAAVFLLGAGSGATAAVVGFGIGSLLTPLLMTRYEPALAVGIVAIPHLLAAAVRFFQHRLFIDRAVLLQFGVLSALGGFAGAWLQGSLPQAGLSIVLGALLLATAVANLTQGFHEWKPGRATAGGLGLLSGVFGGLVGNQGGLRAAGLLAFDLSPRAYLATSTAVALLIDAARTPIYVARAGEALRELWLPITVAAAGCLLGTVFGERVLLGMPKERYRQAVGAAVGAVGIWLLVAGLTR